MYKNTTCPRQVTTYLLATAQIALALHFRRIYRILVVSRLCQDPTDHYQYEPSKRPEKGKGPTEKLNVSDQKKNLIMFPCPRQDFHQSQTYFMLPEMLKRISTQGRTDEPEACTSAITTEKVEDIFRFLMI